MNDLVRRISSISQPDELSPIVRDLACVLTKYFGKIGLPDAELHGEGAALTVSDFFEGSQVYFPVHAKRREARDAEIYEAYDGKNLDSLRMKFRIGHSAVYKAIRRHRKRLRESV